MKCVHERNPVDKEKQNMNNGPKGKWQIGRRASGKSAEGWNMQSDWGNKYETWLWKKYSWTNAKSRSGKLAEGQVANRPKGEKQLYSRTQWTCVSFFDDKW